MKQISIPGLKVNVVKRIRMVTIDHQVESYWVGLGVVGHCPTNAGQQPLVPKPHLIPRRYLRCRDADGIVTYFKWTEPDKGKMFPRVVQFRKRVELTRIQCQRHFNKEK